MQIISFWEKQQQQQIIKLHFIYDIEKHAKLRRLRCPKRLSTTQKRDIYIHRNKTLNKRTNDRTNSTNNIF